MAESSWPSPDNTHVVNDTQYEQLVVPQTHGIHGVIGGTADTPVVYGDSSGKQVKVRPGKGALLRGHRWASDPSVDTVVALTTNTSGNPRIDRIVLRFTRSTNDVNVAVLAGTPAGSPVAPTLTQNTGTTGVYEICLAQVLLANNYTTVTAGNVTPEQWYVGPGGLIVCTSTTHPRGVDLGTRIYETDTLISARWDGAAFIVEPATTAWTDFSASFTVTATTTNPTKGSSTYLAHYIQLGKTVHNYFQINFSGWTNGSGTYRFLLPVTAHASLIGVGSVWVNDSGTAVLVGCTNFVDSTHVEIILYNIPGVAIGSTGPGGAGWATNDILKASLTYEAA